MTTPGLPMVGERVQLYGLVDRVDLNGQRAIIVSSNTETGRAQALLVDGSAVSVKYSNLKTLKKDPRRFLKAGQD